ncbi:MAG TPA: glycosyltransferase, partial [Pyrinomonadaceae bacterium]|nr:glycosyltransferase [Pyrinomonadaceae bacterium]
GRYGVPASRVRLICPHAAAEPPPDVELPRVLREFFDAHEQVLTTVGLLEEHYDLALQIDALARVRERFPGAGLVIIGSGSIEGELRRLIESKPYARNVLLCGDVEHAETLRAISESDLFLRTTFYDGDSISVREALHLGVPVIATRTELRPEGVQLIPVGDGAALAEAVNAHLSGGVERDAREGAGARGAASAGADEGVAAVLELYEELLGEGRG